MVDKNSLYNPYVQVINSSNITVNMKIEDKLTKILVLM